MRSCNWRTKAELQGQFSYWSLCHLVPSSYAQPQLLLWTPHFICNYLLDFSMWMSKRHLKFNVQNWTLGFSPLHPLSNLLFLQSFPVSENCTTIYPVTLAKKNLCSTSPSHNPSLTTSMASIGRATINFGLGPCKNLLTGLLASICDLLPLLFTQQLEWPRYKVNPVMTLFLCSALWCFLRQFD